MCPIETPEGPNIGLIGSLSSYGRVNAFGFVETPYRKVKSGKVTDQIEYLTADEEDRHVIAQANTPIGADGTFAEDRVLVRRKGGEIDYIGPDDVDYMDVSPRQMVSVATAMIPFLEHDDANRALMGSNMQRQSVPLLRSEAPLVGTGMEYRAATDAGDVIVAEQGGVVEQASADFIAIANDDGTRNTYLVAKFRRSNQGTCFNQKPVVEEGQRVEAGQVIADGPCTDHGEMALGRNLLVAFMPWEGHNYEDAIILSQRLVQDDVLSSIHIEEHEVDARDTKLGPEEITRDIPNVSEDVLADLDDRGIIRIEHQGIVRRRLDEGDRAQRHGDKQRDVQQALRQCGRADNSAAAERRLRRIITPRSIRALRAQQCERRARQDVDVEQDRPVLDVIEVVLDAALDLFLAVGFAAPAVDLRPAGDAGLHPVAGEIAVHRLVVDAGPPPWRGPRAGADRPATGCRRTRR